ncbi:hypothetical protein LLG46_03815 [bacterium]|nr:hypothetical protein [bacterium]
MGGNIKVGLFFGAGAEVCYGLPSGGKFALDLFRANVDKEKTKLRNNIKSVNKLSVYANKWLPNDFDVKRIHAFGRSDFASLLQSIMEYRRYDIIKFLDEFDIQAERVLQSWDISKAELNQIFKSLIGEDIGDVIYDQKVSLSTQLGANTDLFKSEYFSALLEVLKNRPESELLTRSLRAFLQLLIGCHGQNLASGLNQALFAKAPNDLPIFDDIGGVFRIDLSCAGLTALELVLEEEAHTVSSSSSMESIFGEFARKMLEVLLERHLNYQALIDEHFRYLYDPRAEWAKFTKIVIFLNTARTYILNKACGDSARIKDGPGYYHDLLNFGTIGLDIRAIGTTNYNSLVPEVAEGALSTYQVEHLNGSVHDFYDPYLNTIVHFTDDNECLNYERITVPLMFTQSGIKPLTCIEMSKRYVGLYDSFCDSDAVVVVGFGFNGDDGHVNGLFRNLIDECNKDIYICHYQSNGSDSAAARNYERKLRITNRDRLHIIGVNDERKTLNGDFWYESIAKAIIG